MKKDKKFLAEIEKNLGFMRSKKKKEIISKYENIIKKEKSHKKKITSILKELGDPYEIAIKEKALLRSESIFKRLIDFIVSLFNNIKKFFADLFIKFKNKDYIGIIKKSINKFINRMKKLFNKFKREKKVLEIKDKIEESIVETKEEIVSTIEVVSENTIFESKEAKRKRYIRNTCEVLILSILLILWLFVCSLFMSSIVAYLDGIKFVGVSITLFGLSMLLLWLIIVVNNLLFRKRIHHKLNLIVILSTVFISAIGVALSINFFTSIENVSDVSLKYSMTTKTETHKLPSDLEKRFYINFNANYDTQYIVEYDDRYKDSVKIEVKYYESYYDFYTKKTTNNVYVSLKLDTKDRISVYLDDLKEGKVYDNDELSRYTVKIYVSKDDFERLVILD